MEVATGVAEVVLMVKVEVAGDPPGVTGLETNAQVAPVGRLNESQPRVTALLNPCSPVTEIVYEAGLPWTTVRVVGLAPTLKSGGVNLKATLCMIHALLAEMGAVA